MALPTKQHEKNRSDQQKADSPNVASGGEDESSTEKDGDDSHLHEDQKAPSL